LVDFRAVPSEYIDRTSLPRSVELTRPGDVFVVTGGRVRAGVDFDGGAVVVGAIQIIRPTTNLVGPEVLAVLITYHGQQQAVVAGTLGIDLKSLEIPLPDARSTQRLRIALRTLSERRRWAAAAVEAVDDLTDALLVGVSTRLLAFADSDESERP
jgi:hypothetical protein